MSQAPATVSQEINGLYVALYNRAADMPGINYWVGQLHNYDPSVTLTTAISVADAQWLGQQFVSTQATYFASVYQGTANPTNNPTVFVEALYQNIGGNQGDPGGIEYWTNLLTTAEGTSPTTAQIQAAEAAIAGHFVHDMLSIDLHPINGTDAVANAAALGLSLADYNAAVARQQELLNKVDVSQYYANESVSPAGSILVATSASIPPTGAFAAAIDAIAGISNNPATVAIAEAAIAASVAAGNLTAILALPTTAPGTIYTLTTGTDAPGTGAFATSSITGNNNLIIGTFSAQTGGTAGTGATYNVGDQIIAPAGSTGNTLSLSDLGAGGVGTPTAVAATVSNIQTLNINSGQAVAANTVTSPAGFNGLTQLTVNSTDNAANADNITAASTTAITVTDLASGASGTITLNGGAANTVTETDTDGGAAVLLSSISIGATTAPAGAVTVTATDTLTTGASAPPNITVNGGTAAVTVTSTVNDGIALSATTGTETANDAGTITVTNAAAGTGVVVVNDALNATAVGGITTNADAVTESGGSTSVTVNETVSQIQTATSVSSVTEGAVSVTGGAATMSVTVNQASVATGHIVTAAVAAVNAVATVTGVTAAPGLNAVTAVVAISASAAVTAIATGTPTVTADGAVTIADKNHATATTASNSITSITLSNYGASTIADNALTTLSLSGTTAGTLGITNAAAGAATNTTLALSVNGLGKSTAPAGTITDSNAEITTLNVTTGATASYLGAFSDTGLKTLSVAGSSVLTMATVNTTITALTVTGAAGFSDGSGGYLSGTGVTAFAPTSSGKITVTMNDTTQTFTGSSTGTSNSNQDVITISADATKAITGGSATNNEIILSGDAATFDATVGHLTTTNVTGFTTLGVTADTATTAEVYNLALLTGFNAIDDVASIAATTGSTAFTYVTAGTSLALEAAVAGSGNVAAEEGTVAASLLYFVGTAQAVTGADTVSLTLGKATTGAVADGILMFEDAAGVGIATINVATLAASGTVGVDTISTLIDNGLANLSVSGPLGLTIGTLNEASTQATAFALTNTSSNAVTITAFTDANLSSLSFAGTGSSSITTLTDSSTVLTISNTGTGPAANNGVGTSAVSNVGTLTDSTLTSLTLTGSNAIDVGTFAPTVATLAIANTGTSTATVGDSGAGAFGDASLTSLTLTNNVAIGTNTLTPSTATGATSGVTIVGTTDSAHVNINLTGAVAGKTDTIGLGNGNDFITDGSTAGTVNVTVGTGSNLIVLGGTTSDTTGAYNVILGTHTSATGPDYISIGTAGTAYATTPNLTIGNVSTSAGQAVIGDRLYFAGDASSSGAALTATTAGASAPLTITAVEAAVHAIGAHGVAYSIFGGNTYVAETISGALAGTDTTLVELVGTHTFTASTGYLTLLT